MNLQEQLTQINEAISKIEKGAQEYKIGSRYFKKPDLSLLYQERRDILRRIEENDNSSIAGTTYVARFVGNR